MLFPLFLLGGLALSVPLIVHLRNQAATTPERFPALRFLVQAKVVSARWRELMRWLVLLLRLLALAALVLAFAQPWFGGPVQTGVPPAVLLVDVSASMQAGDAFPSAIARAEAWLSARPAGTPVAVVAFDRAPRPVVRLEDGQARIVPALRELKPGWASGDLDGALRSAERLLADHPGAGRIIAVATDGAAAAVRRIAFDRPLAPGITVDWLLPAGPAPANLAITGLRHDACIEDPDRPLVIEATIANHGPAARALTVRCAIEDRAIEDRPVSVPPGGSTEVRFAVSPRTSGGATQAVVAGSIAITDAGDVLAADDVRYVAIPAQGDQTVMRIALPSSDDRILRAATAPADGGRFRVIAAADLSGLAPGSILVIDVGASLDTAGIAALAAHRARGGAIAIVATDQPPAGWESSVLGLSIGAVERPVAPVHVASSDLRHPVLQPFARPASGDLSGFGVACWRPMLRGDLRPLLTLDGGGSLLAVADGTARLAVVGVRLDRTWSDWPANETLVPVWQQTLRWLAGGDGVRRNGLLVGDPGITATQPGLVIGADGLRRAVNLDAEESDLARWTARQVLDRLRNSEDAATSSAMAAGDRADAGRRLAWWLLLAVAVLSMTELLIANRTPR
jgi:hypothetical protein